MIHHFKVALATEFSIEEAILIDEFHFQISRNRANERNFHDGRYWTYNTLKAYAEIFPYFSKDQIKRIIQKLITRDILMKGNYNENPYNQTSWYAFTDFGESIVKSCYIDSVDSPHRFGEIAKCTNGEIAKCKTSTITTTETSNYNDSLFPDGLPSQMPTCDEKKNIGADRPTADERDAWFEELWKLYERKGNKQIAKKEFANLDITEEIVAKMRLHIPAYIESASERHYRLDFERYLKRATYNTVVFGKQNAILYDPDATEEVQTQSPAPTAETADLVINGIKYR